MSYHRLVCVYACDIYTYKIYMFYCMYFLFNFHIGEVCVLAVCSCSFVGYSGIESLEMVAPPALQERYMDLA